MIKRLLVILLLLSTSAQAYAGSVFGDVFDLGGGVDVFDLSPSGNVFEIGGEVADMVNISSRQVYTTLISAAGITEDPLDTAAIQTYIEALTPNAELAAYDFSGTTIFRYKILTKDLTQSSPATLISDTFAIASDHSGPQVNDTLFWRTPAGGMASATVAEIYADGTFPADTTGEFRLVRLNSNPDATLKRYAIANNSTMTQYIGGALWHLYQNQELKLRVMNSLTTTGVIHSDSIWNNAITQGSGRPGFVALTNGELVITGELWTLYGAYVMDLRSPALTSAIQTELDSYSETLNITDLPAPNYSDGTGDGQYINYSIFKGRIFGRD